MNEDQASINTSTTDSSSALDSYDFSLPDGGLNTDEATDEAQGDATTDEADQSDNTEQTTEDQQEDGDTDGISKMTQEERNNFFAQRRIEQRRTGEQKDQAFLGQLRDQVREEFIDVDPNEELFEDMDPQVAQQLRELRQNDRMRSAERALEQIATVRETTRLGVLQAEASIPMFNQADPAYNGTFHDKALSNYAHRFLIVRPGPDGEPQVVGTKEGAPSPLEYLQQEAQEYEGELRKIRAASDATARRNASIADTRSSSTGSSMSSSEALEARVANIPLDSF